MRLRAQMLALALLLGGCLAHYPRPDEPLEFMERTSVGYPVASGQVLEADAAIHLLLWNGLDRPDVWRTDGTYLTASLSFMGIVRMYDEKSNPVRTPTYQPRLKLQLVRVEAPETGQGLSRRLGAVGAVELQLGHQSNGQKGCALSDHVRGTGDSDFDCVPSTDPPSSALNLTDGSFTRNYLGLGTWGKVLVPSEAGGAVALSLTAGASVEWNVPCSGAGCIEPQMRARYGEVLANWAIEADALLVRGIHRAVPGLGPIALDARLRGSVRGSIHLGLADRHPFGDVTAEVAWLPRYARGFSVGPFVRYHLGGDYLNIRFEERLDVWTVGLLVDPAPPEQL